MDKAIRIAIVTVILSPFVVAVTVWITLRRIDRVDMSPVVDLRYRPPVDPDPLLAGDDFDALVAQVVTDDALDRAMPTRQRYFR